MNSQKVVIVGGVAGGASAAARARRLSEDAEIVLFERDQFISFANCGLPYHISGDIPDRQALLVQTPKSMMEKFNLDIRIQTEVIAINTEAKTVTARNLVNGEQYEEPYDKLVLSPGAAPWVPPIPGLGEAKYFTLRNIPDMDRIKRRINIHAPRSAAVIGGGFIGIEMAEALVANGIETTLIEASNQVMAPIDPEMATPLHQELRRRGVRLLLNEKVCAVDTQGGQTTLVLKDSQLPVDMIILAVGVKPEVTLARDAGLALGATGAIQVNPQMQSSDPDIFAVGDAVQVQNLVSGQEQHVPLAGPANRQGRIAADVIFGRPSAYQHNQGTSVCKVFELAVAATGLNEKQLRQNQTPFEKIYLHSSDHANYYPGATNISFKVLFEPNTGELFGAQAVGPKGVDKRIDVIATAMRGHMKVQELADLELCYAPPFGSAKDVVNHAGNVASNLMYEDMQVCQAENVHQCSDNMLLVDVRNPEEIGELGAIDQSINIPLTELRKRMDELPRDKNIVVYCAVGLRGYIAQRILTQRGFQVKNLSGGYRTYQMLERVGC